MQASTELKSLTQVGFGTSNYFIAMIFIDSGWSHVKEIPNTKLLVSLDHRMNTSARMAIYDISKQGKINKVYSLGDVPGGILIFSYLHRLNNYIFH